jgi:hypothetical protein
MEAGVGMPVFIYHFPGATQNSSCYSDCAMVWTIRGSNPGSSGIFLFSKMSRPAMRPILPFIKWVPSVLFPGIKQLGREVDHLPPSGAEVKNEWSYISSPPMPLSCARG